MTDLTVHVAGMTLKNPVIAASGTFGFGREYGDYIPLSSLGGIAVKGLTLAPRPGNPPPRIAETPSGILNSVGLQNPGIRVFLEEELPWLKSRQVPIIANIAGDTADEYGEMAAMLDESDVCGIEVNVSCPNVRHGGMAFGTDPAALAEVVGSARKHTRKPLIIKLSPNVTSIVEMARISRARGADAVSLINTVAGMAVDVHIRRPILGNIFGGLSGPAVRPIALKMVYEVSRAVDIPVIGMGGITTGEDAVAFLLCGASAVMVGTANFMYPDACLRVAEGIRDYMERYGVARVGELVGGLKTHDGQ